MENKSSRMYPVLVMVMIVLVLLTTSCPTAIEPPPIGSLRLTATGIEGRTIEPSWDEISVTNYRVTGEGPSEATFDPVVTTESTIYIDDLVEGTWSITIEGLNSENVVIASKTLEVQIEQGKQTKATFRLEWLEGFGNFEVIVSWPSSITTFSRIHGVLELGGVESGSFDLFTTDAVLVDGHQQVSKQISGLATGSHTFVLTFFDELGNEVGLPYMDQVNVYHAMTSQGVCRIPVGLLPPETPVIHPDGGTIDSDQEITISCASPEVRIYYTTDGSCPDMGSMYYSKPFTLEKNCTVKAIAIDETNFSSAVATAVFEVPVATPRFSLAEGTYDEPRMVGLDCANEGAVIHYTIDGTDPTEASASYTSALAITENTTVRAIAVHPDYKDSSIATAEYSIRAGNPIFSEDDGVDHHGPLSIQLSSVTTGATILYTTDGSDPTISGTTYDPDGGITLESSATIKAYAKKTNMVDSEVISKTYSILPTAETPLVIPSSGTYAEPQEISITTASETAQIRYTLDGSDPDASSTLYSAPFTICEDTILKARSFEEGAWVSPVVEHTYGIQVASPEYSPSGGTYTGSQSVAISSATEGATIHYTLDGSDPTDSSPLYTGALAITSNTTVKAIGVKEGMTDSDIVSSTYTIQGEARVTVEDPDHHTVEIVLPPEWEDSSVTAYFGGVATCSISPTPTEQAVQYSWYWDGEIARDNTGSIASTGPSIIFGNGGDEVALEPGPHQLVVKVKIGTMTYSDQSFIRVLAPVEVFEVSFDAQGGGTPSPLVNSVTNGYPYGTLASITYPGYTFKGWWTQADGGGTLVTKDTTVNLGTDQVLYAYWVPNTYRITFDGQQGTITGATEKEVVFDTNYGTLPSAERVGYHFGGWWTEADGGGTQIFSDTMLSRDTDHTLYANWIPLTVTFNALGGLFTTSSGGLTPEDQQGLFVYDEPYGNLPSPEWEKNMNGNSGYTFDGWWTSLDDAGERVSEDTIVSITEDHTLYAKWTAHTYTVTFDATERYPQFGGETPVASPSTKIVVFGQPYGPLATAEGYGLEIDGWEIELSDGSRYPIYEDSTVFWPEDHLLIAHWSSITYTISFDSEEGSEATSKNVKFADMYGTLPASEKPGYGFDGWWTGEGGTGNRITPDTEMLVPSDHTLYAKWMIANYSITYYLGGGQNDIDNPNQYTIEDNTITLLEPSRVGYTFAGWYTDESFENPIEQIVGGSTGNIELYAQWEAIDYSITYYLEDGQNNLDNPNEYTIEDNITLLEPSKAGYSFAGWYTDGSFENPIEQIVVGSTGNIEVYAKWLPPFTITYDPQDGVIQNLGTTEVLFGSPYGELATATREGFAFEGWWTAPDDTGLLITPETTVEFDCDFTLYAKWRVYVLGGIGSAGLIFYDKGEYIDGWRYLEAAPSDIAVDGDYTHIFGYYRPDGTNIILNTETGIGSGKRNTELLVGAMASAAHLESSGGATRAVYAAKVCADYTGGGYDDWFLPSRDELNQVYENLKKNNLGGFSEDYYWSSSEDNANAAASQSFYDGYQFGCTRWYGNWVRPVRAF